MQKHVKYFDLCLLQLSVFQCYALRQRKLLKHVKQNLQYLIFKLQFT